MGGLFGRDWLTCSRAGAALVDVGLAVIGWLVVSWLPGMVLADIARPGVGTLRNSVIAPLVGTGLTMIIAEGYYLAGAPIRSSTVLPISIGFPVVGWVLTRATARRNRHGRYWASAPVRGEVSRVDAACLGAAFVVGVVLWCLVIRSTSAVLPNTDGAHHALFAARILRAGTLNPRVVLSGDLASGTPHSAYYPLALHVSTALITGLTGASVNTVLTVGYVLAASVLLPLGMFVLMRSVCPQVLDAAPVVALLAVTFTWFPFGPITWGGVPTIVAMCQVPAALDAVLLWRGNWRHWAVGLLLGTALYGLFQEHNSELVTVALYGLLLGVPAVRRLDTRGRRDVVVVWAIAAALIAALVVPQIHQLLAGATDASAFLGNPSNTFGGTPTRLTPGSGGTVLRLIFSPVVLAVAIGGAVAAVRRRLVPGLGWCVLATVALLTGTLYHVPALTTLTTPWYQATIRITYLFSYFEIIYAAIGLAMLVRAVAWRAERESTPRVRPIGIAFALLLAAVLTLAEIPAAIALAGRGYRDSSLVAADQRAAFAWLAANVRPGDRVLNDFSDGSGWMETLDRVTPVFATKPTATGDVSAQWGDRWYLLSHAADLAASTRAQEAVGTWHVRFVYVDERHFDGTAPSLLSARSLARSRAYREVWHAGTVTIFAVELP